MDTSKIKFVIRWGTRDKEAIFKIRKRFNIPDYTTLNGWSPVEIDSADKDIFDECARRGFFSILPVKWCQNGDLFSFKSCQ